MLDEVCRASYNEVKRAAKDVIRKSWVVENYDQVEVAHKYVTVYGAREEHVCPRECERPQVSFKGSGHAQFCPVRKYEAQQEYYGADGVE